MTPSADINSALLEVHVPAGATVYVNGTRSNHRGEVRRFSLRPLKPGRVVNIEVRAEIMRDDKLVQERKAARIRAGESLTFDFRYRATILSVHVPNDATVYLEGKATKATGPIRVFRTTRLPAGQKISDYSIRVCVERNGRIHCQERSIMLTSGESQSLVFDGLKDSQESG